MSGLLCAVIMLELAVIYVAWYTFLKCINIYQTQSFTVILYLGGFILSTYIYIDDSGTSGDISHSKHIDTSRKIWAAIVLTSDVKYEIEEKIKQKLCKINIENKTNLSEFHFTNIYSSKKEYANLSPEIRLEIIQWFVDLYNEYRPYVLVTSCDKNTLKNSGFSETFLNFSIDGFRFKKPDDFSLWLLLLMCQEHLLKNPELYQLPTQIYIDSGRQKAGSTQTVLSISDVCQKGEIAYCSSSDFLIQFADFIVFVLNRIQNNLVKSRRPFDIIFLEKVGQIEWNTDVDMIAIKSDDLGGYGVSEYDTALDRIVVERQQMPKELIDYMENLCKGIDFMKNFLEKLK